MHSIRSNRKAQPRWLHLVAMALAFWLPQAAAMELSPPLQDLVDRYDLNPETLTRTGPLSVTLPEGRPQMEIELFRYGPSPLTVIVELAYFSDLPGSLELARGWEPRFLTPGVSSWKRVPAPKTKSTASAAAPAGEAFREERYVADTGQSLIRKFDRRGCLVEIDYCGAYRLQLQYNDKERIVAMTDSAGRTARISYSAPRLLAELSRSPDEKWAFSYDDKQRISRVSGPANFQAAVKYNAAGRVASVEGTNRLTIGYSAADAAALRMTVLRDRDPVKIVTVDKAGGRRISVGIENGPSLVYQFDAKRRIAEVADSTGRTDRFGYDADGNLVRRVNPSGAVTAMTYDRKGRLASVTDPSGLVTTFERNAQGQVVREKDTCGRERNWSYDERGLKATAAEKGGTPTTFLHSPQGQLIEEVSPRSRVRHAYNSLGQWVKSDNGLNNCEFLHSESGDFKGLRWDGKDAFLYEYDPAGRITGFTDHGRKYVYVWTEDRLRQVIAPSGKVTKLLYGPDGNLTGIEFPEGSRIGYQEDAMGTCVLRDKMAAQIRIQPDALGRPTRIVNGRGQEIRTAFNGMNLPTQIQGADQAGGTLSYDPAGRLARIQTPNFTQTLQYDAANRVVKIQDSRLDGAVTHEYDLLNHRTATTLPGYGRIAYTYNLIGQLESVADPSGGVFAFEYGPDGQRKGITYPNKLRVNYRYDSNGRLARIQLISPQGQEMSSLAYEYDEWGQRVGQRDGKGRGWKLTLDADGQISTLFSTTGRASRIQYDAGGNILQDGEQAWKYDAANRLVQMGAETFSYDADGNLAEQRGKTAARYEYDSLNRLISADCQGQRAAYQYDPLGRRSSRRVGERETLFFLDGDDVLFEFTRDQKADRIFILGDQMDETLAVHRPGGEKLYLVQDGMRNVRWIVDDGGRLLGELDYGLWGDCAGATPLLTRVGRGFTGREFDPETGLYYMRARYYSPPMRRFLSVDPADRDPQMPLSMHPYLYCLNNPAQFADPYGMWESPFSKIINFPGRVIKAGANAAGGMIKGAYNAITGTIHEIKRDGIGGYVDKRLSDAGQKFMDTVSNTTRGAGSLAHGHAADAADATPAQLEHYQQARPQAARDAEEGLNNLTRQVTPIANIYEAANIASDPDKVKAAGRLNDWIKNHIQDRAAEAGIDMAGAKIKEINKEGVDKLCDSLWGELPHNVMEGLSPSEARQLIRRLTTQQYLPAAGDFVVDQGTGKIKEAMGKPKEPDGKDPSTRDAGGRDCATGGDIARDTARDVARDGARDTARDTQRDIIRGGGGPPPGGGGGPPGGCGPCR